MISLYDLILSYSRYIILIYHIFNPFIKHSYLHGKSEITQMKLLYIIEYHNFKVIFIMNFVFSTDFEFIFIQKIHNWQ